MFVVISLVVVGLCGLLAYYIAVYNAGRAHMVELAEKIPGPKCVPLFNNVLELGTKTTDFPINVERLIKIHGITLRLWLGFKLFVIALHPRDVEIILGSNKTIDKGQDYNFLKPWIGTGLLTSTGEKWRQHRKIITPTFHFKILEQFVDIFNANGDILISKLKERANGSTFEINKYITLYTLDNISESAMGVKVDAQSNSDSEYVRAVRDVGEIVMQRSVKPWLRLDVVFNLLPAGRLFQRSLQILHDVTNRVIKVRREELKERKKTENTEQQSGASQVEGVKKKLAFLDLLLEASSNGSVLSDQDIREEVDTFMFEGHDTTSSAISFAFMLLAEHQQIQDNIVAELDALFDDTNAAPTFRNLQEMKYLERVIKEVLRLYPSVPVMARETFEDIPLHDGLIIPSGATVVIIPMGTHRHPDFFEDPETFDPDRFLPENVQGRHPYCYVPFSAGPRNCIGQKFAMMEMKCGISHVLRHFKIFPAPIEEGVQLTAELILKSKTGIRVKIVPRK